MPIGISTIELYFGIDMSITVDRNDFKGLRVTNLVNSEHIVICYYSPNDTKNCIYFASRWHCSNICGVCSPYISLCILGGPYVVVMCPVKIAIA